LVDLTNCQEIYSYLPLPVFVSYYTLIPTNSEEPKILKEIEVKPELAEEYFQLGLTYQANGEHDQAETYKVKALKLFGQMEAPKQIERVNQAFEQGAKK